MNRRDLDNYITGHYGEDQFEREKNIEETLEAQGNPLRREDTVTAVTKLCGCGTVETHAFSTAALEKWRGGMLIQHAMPDVNECLREFLITGNCEACRARFDAIFAAMEDE